MASETFDFRGPQYWHWHDFGDGNIRIYNGKWNHVFKWYDYTNGDPSGYDHPKHVELAYIDEEGKKWYHWVYEQDESSPTGYPTVPGDGANLAAGSGNDTIILHFQAVAVMTSS